MIAPVLQDPPIPKDLTHPPRRHFQDLTDALMEATFCAGRYLVFFAGEAVGYKPVWGETIETGHVVLPTNQRGKKILKSFYRYAPKYTRLQPC